MNDFFDRWAWLYNPLVRLSGHAKRNYRLVRELAEPKKSDLALDVGGGTGLIAGYLAHDVRRVVVLDRAEKMLSRAPDNVTCVQGVAQHIPFREDTFDIVYCVDAFHHFTNSMPRSHWKETIDACVSELLRVLDPDGVMILVEFDPDTLAGRIVSAVENSVLRLGSSFYPPDRLKSLFEQHSARARLYKYRLGYAAKITK